MITVKLIGGPKDGELVKLTGPISVIEDVHLVLPSGWVWDWDEGAYVCESNADLGPAEFTVVGYRRDHEGLYRFDPEYRRRRSDGNPK